MKKTMLAAISVGATSSRPLFEGITKRNQKGITLIALIITIIVMLVLVGVTINVALNGGLFEKGEKAAYQTNVATIKEQVAIKKAEILADNNGKAPDDYEIDLSDLQISEKLKTEFQNKLTISKDGTLYYIDGEINNKEKAWLEEIGIGPAITGEGPTGEQTGLIYGKSYVMKMKFTFESETFESTSELIFSKEHNKAALDNQIFDFTYDATSGALEIGDEDMTGIVSVDGLTINNVKMKSVSGAKIEVNYVGGIYSPKESGVTSLKLGIYKNNGEYLSIVTGDSGNAIFCKPGGSFTYDDVPWSEDNMSYWGISIVSDGVVEYEGKQYTLLQNFE